MQHGDMRAFDELGERYKDDAYRLACLITGSRTDGDRRRSALCHLCAVHQIAADGSKFRPCQNAFRAAWKYCRKAKRETPVSSF